MANGTNTKLKSRIYPLLRTRERKLVWEKARGMWRRKKPEPIRELEKMRREWERN
ncbi:hypothetical protein HYW67_03230 [Candidatus Parcubacteria bacterium]|nr:hypothetical protein [Candidatus Parcubacteria bacterium]